MSPAPKLPPVPVNFQAWNDPPSWDDSFRALHPELPAGRLDPLYALPAELLSEIGKELPDWLSDEEFEFERQLTLFCAKAKAVGIAEGRPVHCSWLKELPSAISLKRFNEMGWDQLITYRQCTDSMKQIAALVDPINDQHQAFLGWLLTNPRFCDERDTLRQSRKSQIPWRTFDQCGPADTVIRQFLDRWMLCELSSWELPIPQGPNLSSIPWPKEMMGGKVIIAPQLPITMGINARYPLRQHLEGLRRRQTPEHLLEWLDIQGGVLTGYFHLFPLHFYRHVVLPSRYSDRIAGHVEPLDRVMGEFIGVGEDAVKKLRLTLARRFKSSVSPQSTAQTSER